MAKRKKTIDEGSETKRLRLSSATKKTNAAATSSKGAKRTLDDNDETPRKRPRMRAAATKAATKTATTKRPCDGNDEGSRKRPRMRAAPTKVATNKRPSDRNDEGSRKRPKMSTAPAKAVTTKRPLVASDDGSPKRPRTRAWVKTQLELEHAAAATPVKANPTTATIVTQTAVQRPRTRAWVKLEKERAAATTAFTFTPTSTTALTPAPAPTPDAAATPAPILDDVIIPSITPDGAATPAAILDDAVTSATTPADAVILPTTLDDAVILPTTLDDAVIQATTLDAAVVPAPTLDDDIISTPTPPALAAAPIFAVPAPVAAKRVLILDEVPRKRPRTRAWFKLQQERATSAATAAFAAEEWHDPKPERVEIDLDPDHPRMKLLDGRDERQQRILRRCFAKWDRDLDLEETLCQDFKGPLVLRYQKEVDAAARRTLLEWMYGFCDPSAMGPRTLDNTTWFLASFFVDVYLTVTAEVKLAHFQIIGLSMVNLAAAILQFELFCLDDDILALLSPNETVSEEELAMLYDDCCFFADRVLTELEFEAFLPTCVDFAKRAAHLASLRDAVEGPDFEPRAEFEAENEECNKEMIRLLFKCRLDADFNEFLESGLAAAAFWCFFDFSEADEADTWAVVTQVTGYGKNAVVPILRKMMEKGLIDIEEEDLE
ncbi:hypothetical protein BC832DRAFT_619530 [Gaertneriomyces semiglobifer]|nr:hypothetical protein BC832DRAFT_619530 [Gaertneriomyces semiglobifer]